MQSHFSKVQVYLAGICSLIVTVGAARFSYTSLLPVMQAETGISETVSGWLATANFLGYITGVLLAASLNSLSIKFQLYRLYLVLTIFSTGLMALTTDPWLWAALRYIAGTCSSAGLILASGLILKWLVQHKHRPELGIHFSGAGISIVLTALLVEGLIQLAFNWQYQWLGFAVMSLLFSIPAWLWMPAPDNTVAASGSTIKDNPPSKTFTRVMLLAYFCAGYGYVVSSTFIVDIVEETPNLQGLGQWTFVLIGLATIPAALIWDLIARKQGYLRSLFFAYSLQAVGIVLPALSDHLIVILLSALLFGGTFIACVSLVLTMAGQFYPSNPTKFMGKMTLAYGVAQIVAPAFTGILTDATGNYDYGLYVSAAVMCIGSLMVITLSKRTETPTQNTQTESTYSDKPQSSLT